jgi:hypothetical protein
VLRDDGIDLGWVVRGFEDIIVRVERSHKLNHPLLVTPLPLFDIEARVEFHRLAVLHDLHCEYLARWLTKTILAVELTVLGYMDLTVENTAEVTLSDE